MSRMDRVKYALSHTLTQVREECQQTPNPYIIGFHNGLSLAEHHLNLRPGKAHMIELGAFRVVNPFLAPGAANPEPSAEDTHEYEYLVDQILTAAKQVCWSEGEEQRVWIVELGKRTTSLDQFINRKLEAENGAVAQGKSNADGVQAAEVAGSNPASPSQPEGVN